jgi:hypothetical protein
MRELELLEEIQKRYSPAVLFRNDCGSAWVGSKIIKGGPDRVILSGARRISYGLLKGSADLVGWETIEITPDMVGQKVARFLSIEAKTENDTIKPDQVVWIRIVRGAGGRAIVVREVSGKVFEEELRA